jgi:hypothetical protein
MSERVGIAVQAIIQVERVGGMWSGKRVAKPCFALINERMSWYFLVHAIIIFNECALL